MRFETSMDVLNKRSLLTLVYVCIYISSTCEQVTKEFNFLSKHPHRSWSIFRNPRTSTREILAKRGQKRTWKPIYFRGGREKRAFHGWTIIRSRIGLNLVFLKLRFPPTVRNNARERGKRQVRSLECLQMAKKIGRLLSLDARRG